MKLAAIPTPALLLDRPALLRNIQALHRAVARHGVALRPQTQAAKSADVARLVMGAADTGGRQADPGSGIAVSTLAEAEYFVAHDFTDVLYAVPAVAAKLDQVAKLNQAGGSVAVMVADPATAAAVAAHAGRIQALIVVAGHEAGFCGLPAESSVLLEVAGILGPALSGVTIETADPGSRADFARCTEIDRAGVVRAAARLAAAGFAVRRVSLALSDAALDAASLAGITEVQAGATLFGAAANPNSEPALYLLARVIGVQGRIAMIDAGNVAMGGFGPGATVMRDLADGGLFGHAPVRRLWSERATVELPPGAVIPTVGTMVRLLAADPAMCATGHDRFVVTEGGDEVTAIWPRVSGW